MKYLFSAALLFFTFSLWSQHYVRSISDIHFKEVRDSLRSDFDKKLQRNDITIVRTLNTHIIHLDNDTFTVFFPGERAVALFLTGNFNQLLGDVSRKYDFHYFTRTKGFERAKADFAPDINEKDLLPELSKSTESILLKITGSDLKDDEKRFLDLYLTSILSQVDLRSFDVEGMKKLCQTFLSTFPGSRYYEYVDKVLYIRQKTMDFGIGAGVFSGLNILIGPVSEYFSNYMPLGASVEIGYKRLLLKGDLSTSLFGNIKNSFIYGNESWSNDSTPFMTDVNANLAYVVYNGPKYRITPYAGIGSHGINLTAVKENMRFQPNLNFGVELDWKFADDNSYGTYFEAFNSQSDKTYWHLRFRLGYSQHRISDNRFTGSMLYTKIELGFYSNPAKRLKPD